MFPRSREGQQAQVQGEERPPHVSPALTESSGVGQSPADRVVVGNVCAPRSDDWATEVAMSRKAPETKITQMGLQGDHQAMSTSTGLFQFDPFGTEKPIPAHAEITADPLGQVIATVTAWLPEGVGSSCYHWDRTAFLRVNVLTEQLELIWLQEGEYSLEAQWDIDWAEEGVDDCLQCLYEAPQIEAFQVMAVRAQDLAIQPPDPRIRDAWSDDREFVDGVPSADWSTGAPSYPALYSVADGTASMSD
jgi:hypothetical protein